MKKTGVGVWLLGSVMMISAGGLYWNQSRAEVVRIPYDRPEMVALGRSVYEANCASCHGLNLEGEPNWRQRNVSGLLPAPPHDASGHTWHHPDQMLFDLTKYGVQRFVGADYRSKMPVFEDVIADREIWAALAYIKSTWPDEVIERHNSFDRAPR